MGNEKIVQICSNQYRDGRDVLFALTNLGKVYMMSNPGPAKGWDTLPDLN